MKVLHITPWYPPQRGGIATHVFNLRSRLRLKKEDMMFPCSQSSHYFPRPIIMRMISRIKSDVLDRFTFQVGHIKHLERLYATKLDSDKTSDHEMICGDSH